MRRHLTAAGLLGLALSLGAGEASANIVFTLQLVTFFDGGTATGAFTTNDALDSLIDYDITTSGGIFPGFRYNSTTAPVDSSSIPSILVVEDATPVHILRLTFLDGLTTAGIRSCWAAMTASSKSAPTSASSRAAPSSSARNPSPSRSPRRWPWPRSGGSGCWAIAGGASGRECPRPGIESRCV